MIVPVIVSAVTASASASTAIARSIVTLARHAAKAVHQRTADGAAFAGDRIELLAGADDLSPDIALGIGEGADDGARQAGDAVDADKENRAANSGDAVRGLDLEPGGGGLLLHAAKN